MPNNRKGSSDLAFNFSKRVLLECKRTRFETAVIFSCFVYSLLFLYMPSTMESASEMLGTRISLHLSDRAT